MQASVGVSGKFRLDGRSAIVTGGANGIGFAIANALALAGAKVHIVDLNADAASAAAKRIVEAGGSAVGHTCNVADQDEVDRVFGSLLAVERIHILVNNAGIAGIGRVDTTASADFDRVFEVNVKSVFYCTRACIGAMVAAGGGVILNMASIAASSGLTDRFSYSMSKGAVLSMTYSIARDFLQQNIRCNAISPARVHTGFVDGYLAKNYPGREAEMFAQLSASQPIGRMAEPEEVANLALYLCSDEASFLTGVDYALDGGFFNLRG
jgi:NAD(P)-dependent dehydrogenase (short-subunit alcohol dehydrogenase family)